MQIERLADGALVGQAGQVVGELQVLDLLVQPRILFRQLFLRGDVERHVQAAAVGCAVGLPDHPATVAADLHQP